MGKARKKEKSFGAKIKAGSGITKKENPFDMIFKKANKNKVCIVLGFGKNQIFMFCRFSAIISKMRT